MLPTNNNKKERFLTLCMPPMSEPLPFVKENVAHHLFMGVEHIYIGTHFPFHNKEKYTQELCFLCIYIFKLCAVFLFCLFLGNI